MLFTEPAFLFYFLPALLLLHALCGRALRNPLLLVASLLFYAWGEPVFVAILVVSIAFNYAVGLAIARAGAPAATAASRSGRWLALGLTGNLLLLGHFKYAAFLLQNLDIALHSAGLPSLGIDPESLPALPIGISFFTFQAISYLVDARRGDAEALRNPIDLALYISMFPQLIAGPIVRYADIAQQLQTRQVTREGFAYGIRRFTVGLGKKMLIANTLAVPVDAAYGLLNPELALPPAAGLSFGLAWLAAICFSLQIYFDFSGYSDMAIGLARMFGFQYRENFDYPYTSRSITEFWRRWHISLSTWFRDYLYIPLGGGRAAPGRVLANLWLVFALCGLWHGASWSFLVWGAYHGSFLVLERVLPLERLPQGPAPWRRALTLLIVAVGWVFFRAETLGDALTVLAAMVGLGTGDPAIAGFSTVFDAQIALALAVGLVGSTEWPRRLAQRLDSGALGLAGPALQVSALALLFVAAASLIAAGTFSPFLYFRF